MLESDFWSLRTHHRLRCCCCSCCRIFFLRLRKYTTGSADDRVLHHPGLLWHLYCCSCCWEMATKPTPPPSANCKLDAAAYSSRLSRNICFFSFPLSSRTKLFWVRWRAKEYHAADLPCHSVFSCRDLPRLVPQCEGGVYVLDSRNRKKETYELQQVLFLEKESLSLSPSLQASKKPPIQAVQHRSAASHHFRLNRGSSYHDSSFHPSFIF